MKCPFCGSQLSSVIDKRAVTGTGEIRRRRECLKCKKRYTTYERVSDFEIYIIKRDGRRELFEKAKLRAGIQRALEKRPAITEIDVIVDKIVTGIRIKGVKEIESKVVGRAVLAELRKLDKVAYLRFVSVYRQFQDPGDFTKEVEHLN